MCGGWIKEHIVDPVVGTIKAVIKNPAALLVAVGVGIFNPALGLRMLATMAVSNIFGSFTKKPDSAQDGRGPQQGNPQTLPFDTQNKLQFVYGRAVFSPIMVDAKISTNNQTMWYCLALCEAPDQGESTISINTVYVDGKTVEFDTNGTSVKRFKLEATNADGSPQYDDKVAGKMEIHFYRGNPNTLATPLVTGDVSVLSLMGDNAIAANARWDDKYYMADTIFLIVKLTYNQDAGITGLGNIVVDISNNQNGITDGYKPGSAMLDYLTNSRYGAGLSLDMIDAQSFADLDAYSDEVITNRPENDPNGGATQPRYRFNGMIDTTQVVMNNLLAMADSCDAFIQYNESKGRWAVITNKAYDQLPNAKLKSELFVLDDTNIMGGVNVVPLDLNSTPNRVQSSYNSGKIKGQMTDVYAQTPQRLLNKLEPVNQLTMRYQFVNDYVRAQYLSNRKLEQVRADYIVDLVADYSAIQVDAGDVVLLTYQPYGARDYHITGVSSDPVAKTITVTFDSPDSQPFQAGQRIGISDCKPAAFNGSYIVLSATPSTVTLSSDVVDALVTGGTIYSGLSWSNKPFRVLQVNENRGDDGTLSVKLHMSEYSDQVYDNFTIQDFTPPGKNYVLDGGILGKPLAPTIPQADIKPSDTVPTFKVSAVTPATGVTMAMEFWYSTAEALDPALNNYVLYDTQYNSSSSVYGQSQSEVTTVSGLEAGTYYWRVRAIGSSRKSEFSDSASIDWAPVSADGGLGDNNGNSDKSNMVRVPFVNGKADPANYWWPENTRGIMPAGGITIIAESKPGSIRIDFSTSVWANNSANATASQFNCIEVWKTTAHQVFNKKIFSIRHSYVYGSVNSILTAIGVDMDYRSTDGGYTWTEVSSSSTKKTLLSSITESFNAGGTKHDMKLAVGPYQVADGTWGGQPPYYVAADRFESNNDSTITFNRVLSDSSYRTINTSMNGMELAPNTGGGAYYPGNISFPQYLLVGDNGTIYCYTRNSGSVESFFLETSNTLQNIYSVYANYASGSNFTAIAVGGFGTVLKSNRSTTYPTSKFTWSPKSVSGTDGKTLINHLYGVAGNNGTDTATDVWVAVGAKGTLISSNDNGESWTQRTIVDTAGEAITSTLRAVRYGNGYWVAVGDYGVILLSSDGATWTQINYDYLTTNGWADRNLYTVDYDPQHTTFVIGGDSIILASDDVNPSFSKTFSLEPDENYAISRIWNRGSPENIKLTGANAAVATSNQLLNGQTVSSTIIDTDYFKGDEIGYYLVVGNTRGDPDQEVKAGGSVITATEYKK